ncbi:MAG: DeoR family transcriptional regulator [Phycisphaerales bacterium]|nr:DeoR family transcriptional regulator [Phycisphaerales bacterium]
MNPNLNQRQQQILEKVQHAGSVTIDELTEFFGVTPQTVRRDINILCDSGLLRRFHGGAGLPMSSVENIEYPRRQVMNTEGKRHIAELVASYIPDRSSLFINLGTTTEAVAMALVNHRDLRVITNNLNVAALLCEQPSFDVIITGGEVRRRDHGVVGAETADFIRRFKVDYGIIGISGIDTDGTLLDYDYREVRVAQAIIENSRQVLLVTDHSKFARTPSVRLAHLSDIDVLFTDQEPPAHIREVLSKIDLEVRIPQS